MTASAERRSLPCTLLFAAAVAAAIFAPAGILAPAALAQAAAPAQTQTTSRPGAAPVFEVASIRPHQGPLRVLMGFTASGPRLTLEGYNLRALVMEAFNLRHYQVSFAGSNVGPDEDADINYDIAAIAEGDDSPTKDQFRQMLQVLLADRFKLKFRRETREMPVYALVVAKGGPKLKQSAPDTLPYGHFGVHGRNQTITSSKITMDDLANGIWNSFGPRLPVINKTGLTGAYELKFEATPEYRINNNPQPEDISLFDAVRDQLGLKLELQKASIEVLVVDHVERPSEN
jgi:uncharacterized protein (TIGR03435 family)